MTPEQKQLDINLVHTSTIIEMKEEVSGLQAGQDRIISIIEDEKSFNEARFKEGADKFKELDGRMDEMSKQIADGFKKQEDNFNKYISEGKDDEIKKLTKKLEGRDYVKNGALIVLIGGILLYIAKGIIEKSITPEPKIIYVKEKVVNP